MLSIIMSVGVLLTAVSGIPYIAALRRGEVRPKLVSWTVWAVLGIVMTLAAATEGQLPSALLSGVAATICGAIVVLGWRQGNRSMTKLDIVCLVGAIVGLATFFVMKDSVSALMVSVAVDAVAYIPTLIHGWTDPDEESLSSFWYSAIGQLLVLISAAVGGATIAGLLYPAYAVIFNGLMLTILCVGRFGQSAIYETDEPGDLATTES